MTDPSANETTSRDHLFRAVLAANVIWAVALGFSKLLFASVPEGPNRSLWQWLILVAVVVGVGGLMVAVYRIWPRFLRVPRSVRIGALATTSLIALIGSFIMLAVLFGLVAYTDMRLASDLDNPQCGLSVVIAAIWYPVVLAPMSAAFATWAWVTARDRSKAA